MRGVAGSAAFVCVALWAALAAAAPRDPAPPAAAAAVVPTPPSDTSTAPVPEPALPTCPWPTACAVPPGTEGREAAPSAQPSAKLSDLEGLCQTLAAAAGANELPVDFFIRLIWQESRFDPKAVSRAGAQGVAQFMPATATWRGLADPFDPAEAIVKSAQLLRDLRREFGNLGLAAAAYNAGPARVHDWLAGRRTLPGETRAYVQIITGHSAEDWTGAAADDTTQPNAALAVPCLPYSGQPMALRPGVGAPSPKPIEPWGVELVGSNSEAGALAAYRQLQRKYAAILAGHEPRVVFHGVIRQMGWARIRVGAESRGSAQKLCASLRAAGAGCDVLRN